MTTILGGQLDGVSRMYKIHRTVMEMLSDRGFLVSNQELTMSKQEFIDFYGGDYNNMRSDIRRAKRTDETHQILVSFVEILSMKEVKQTRARAIEEGVQQVIFVVHDKVTPIAKVDCEISVKVHFEIFKETELHFNVTKHKLVPEHQLLTDEEKKTLLEKYTLKETQLPRIQVDDPVAKYLGLKRGQVVKITRSSESAGKYVTYRLAV